MNCSSSAPSGSPKDRHGWNSLQGYLAAHEAQLERLGRFFVERNGLTIFWQDAVHLRIEGRLSCTGGIFLDVRKVLESNERNQVRAILYKYHAGIEGPQHRPIFRYDNSHTYLREGHPDPFHKHRFDPDTWQEITPPLWIGYHEWPTLADVLEELHAWWLAMRDSLDLPT